MKPFVHSARLRSHRLARRSGRCQICASAKQPTEWDADGQDETTISVTAAARWTSGSCRIRYNPAQVDNLFEHLASDPEPSTIYVVATQRLEDLGVLTSVLVHERVPELARRLHTKPTPSWEELLRMKRPALVPVRGQMTSRCRHTVPAADDQAMLDIWGLYNYLGRVFANLWHETQDYELSIVPVVVSREGGDRDMPTTTTTRRSGGSFELRILEPISLGQYFVASDLNSFNYSACLDQLVGHLCHACISPGRPPRPTATATTTAAAATSDKSSVDWLPSLSLTDNID